VADAINILNDEGFEALGSLSQNRAVMFAILFPSLM